MGVERRGWADSKETLANLRGGAAGTLRRSAVATPPRKGSHEPDESRGSRPESVGGWRCNSSGLHGAWVERYLGKAGKDWGPAGSTREGQGRSYQ
jgi:hypothetical protein